MIRFPDLIDFYRQRKSFFYPKTDYPLPTSFLKAPVAAYEKRPLPAHEVTAACRHALGEDPVEVKSLGEPGTFHWLYRVRLAHQRSVILRINALSHLHRDFALFIEPWVMRTLRANHLPFLKIYEVDVSRGRCSFDYEILEEARGQSLRDFDGNEAAIRPLLVELGRFVARLHRIRARGFGLVDVRPWVEPTTHDTSPQAPPLVGEELGRGATGMLETWKEYLFLRLEDHVKKCVEIEAISRVEAGEIGQLIESVAGSLPETHPVLLHGDLGNHNAFTDGKSVTAVIDWEDCLCGDPVFDIALWATFHPEERHRFFLAGYRMENALPEDFDRRFWLYYLRIALSKTVLRDRFAIQDRPARAPASGRLRQGLKALSRTA